MGIDVEESADSWHLRVGAGENWHNLVQYTLEKGMPGLENLALIPGCAGSSPIQNIGAYGIELKHVCEYVDCIELATGTALRLTAEQCRFGYRDSIFKHAKEFNPGRYVGDGRAWDVTQARNLHSVTFQRAIVFRHHNHHHFTA
jgi:UDP-N-acetylmuramate dehydrogenase